MSNVSELGLPADGNNCFHWTSRIHPFFFAFLSFFFSLLNTCGSVPCGWNELKYIRETNVPPSISNLDIFVPFVFSFDASSTLEVAIWYEWLKKTTFVIVFEEVFFPWIQMRCLLVRWTNYQMFCGSKLRHQYQCDSSSDKQKSHAVSKNTFGSNCQG